MTKLVLNFIPIGEGGGVQNALAFLDSLTSDAGRKSECVAIVRRGSALHHLCCKRDIEHISSAANRLSRLAFELTCRRRFLRGQTCFSIAGPPLMRSVGYLLNVNGCAYSNLFYPDLDFWSGHPPLKKSAMEWRDAYLRYWLAKADYWIFETETLRKRAIELCGFPESRVGVVRVAPSSLIDPEKVEAEVSRALDKRIPGGFRFLFFTSPQPHKRVDTLPEIAAQLRNRGETDFVFVTTMAEDHEHTAEIAKKFRAFGMEKHLCNIGPVPWDQPSSLIDCMGAMCTFSSLESFSNNFIEAWRMGKPLLVTDADWARDSCGKAALYVDPLNAAETARIIADLMNSRSLQESLAAEGFKQLKLYLSPAEKFNQYFQCIEEARRLGPCPASDKRKIRWPKCKTS